MTLQKKICELKEELGLIVEEQRMKLVLISDELVTFLGGMKLVDIDFIMEDFDVIQSDHSFEATLKGWELIVEYEGEKCTIGKHMTYEHGGWKDFDDLEGESFSEYFGFNEEADEAIHEFFESIELETKIEEMGHLKMNREADLWNQKMINKYQDTHIKLIVDGDLLYLVLEDGKKILFPKN
jgi:hypothetical protein